MTTLSSTPSATSNQSTLRNVTRNKKQTSLNFVLTNARSLAPKMNSLVDYFEECDLTLAIVAESWLKPGAPLQEDLDDLEMGQNLRIVHHSRKSRRGKNAGGGIAIVYNKNKIKLNERRITKGKAEITCAVGRIPNCPRHLAVIGMYIPPQLRAAQYRAAFSFVCDAINQIKTDLADPYLIVAGDTNKKDINEAIGDYPDLHVIPTAPTRGNEVLDVTAVNFADEVTETTIMKPLSTADGRLSDHSVVLYCACLTNSDRFEWQNYYTRPRTSSADRRFKEWIVNESWT